jgi:hypothetical protein
MPSIAVRPSLVTPSKIIHMKLEGPLARLLTRVDPKLYCEYVSTMEKGSRYDTYN